VCAAVSCIQSPAKLNLKKENQMLKTVWIAFVAFSTPEECDQFLKTNPSLAHGEVQCVIHQHEVPQVKPKRKPK
jgi:hypothetical protein